MSDYRLLSAEALMDIEDYARAAHTGGTLDRKPEQIGRLANHNAALLGHIDAMAAREAKLRELHVKRDETYFQWPVCGVCIDGEEMAPWPCDTIQILDGET